MNKFGALFVFALAFAAVLGQNDVEVGSDAPQTEGTTLAPTPPTKAPSTQAPAEPTTVAPVPPTTKTDPPQTSPTQPPTEAPTKAPTTPSEAPTVAPTTNAPTEAPTEAPTTQNTPTTVTPDVTTQTPTPAAGTFINECIRLTMAAQFSIFNPANNMTVKVNLPENSNATTPGDCGNTTETQTITIPFAGENNDMLELTFMKDGKQFELRTIELKYTLDGNNGPLNLRADNLTLFKVNNENSYVCHAEQTQSFSDLKSNITMSQVRVQAFMTDAHKGFSTAQECALDSKTSNIVPIAVGAALAALVVIVLIAYLISRSRNQSGYESV